ncbi:uroporphyrinogen-III synthase [Haloechinothrix alba]|uniref:Uroporphyrinogen-III synthase n=1 Tax=Haloechinothrix alba TaxID=664784 RepID=A0A238VYX4_9PSEU|nr:uroporphyrinogen-III synthase [Haloechinothrix alba]SNR39530.1 uroporphyrinogen-III synthase [Haloechinothrix alba]
MTVACSGPELPPLTGYTVGVTAARRAEELGALFVRQGAAVRYAPSIRIMPVTDDTELRDTTRGLVGKPADTVIVTSGLGFRGWLEAAEAWGGCDALLDMLRGAELYARGPAAAGAVRAAGLDAGHTPASASTAGLLEELIGSGVAGRRIVVQQHGEPLPHVVNALRAAGAEVVDVAVYRWVRPPDPEPLDRLIGDTVDGLIDALPFTSAPAAASMLARAERTGRYGSFVDALRHDVLVAAVGPAAAGPLVSAGVPVLRPSRSRMGALAYTLSCELTGRAPTFLVSGHTLQVRGQAVVVDGRLRELAPAPMAVLRALAGTPGVVVSRRDLLASLPNGGEEHAVETAVGRLRTALGDPRIVQTVVKRGYRLAIPESEVTAPARVPGSREAGPAGEAVPGW